MKAFKTVKMHPDHAEIDPVLKGKGAALPRMLIVDPTKMKVTVLEKGKLKASGLFKAMQKVASKSYKENLDKLVKGHIKLLVEQDQLVNAKKVLTDKAARLASEDDKSSAKELAKLKKETAEVNTELAEVKKKSKALWTLTPKTKKKSA